MRITIDLQACQRGPSAGRDRALALVKALLHNAAAAPSPATPRLLLNAGYAGTVAPLRLALAELAPGGAIGVFDLPAGAEAAPPGWLRQAGVHIRAAALAADAPALVLTLDASDALSRQAGAAYGDSAQVLRVAAPEDLGALPASQLGAIARADLLLVDDEAARAELRLLPGCADAEILVLPAGADAAGAVLWQALAALPARPPAPASAARPTLAYVSPLPPQQSGIADYSAELLPELSAYYDIDVIVDQPQVDQAWIGAQLTLRDCAYFERHAAGYDHVLYHFGNSPMHSHMFGLLERHPGVVVLHDFYLANLLHHMHHTGYRHDALRQALFRSHGYSGLLELRQRGEDATVWHYPCNLPVLEGATGVIVHSNFPRTLAEQWYGPGAADDWRTLPLLRGRAEAAPLTRAAARAALGLADDQFLVCSFGMLGPTKLSDKLLAAWLGSSLADEPHSHLVFVGAPVGGPYGHDLRQRAKGRARVEITGFAAPDTYQAYLAACDVAVQLRTNSRGETSAAVLDCLMHGVPTIANAHGSSAELPADCLLMLDDVFSDEALVEALLRLRRDGAERARLAEAGAAHIRAHHGPRQVGSQYRDTLEHFARHGRQRRYRALIGALQATPAATPDDQALAARAIAANLAPTPPRQLLVDVSALVQSDLRTGIQRVVRSVINALFAEPPAGYRIEPVYSPGNGVPYRYARAWLRHALGLALPGLDDAPIEARAGDIFLGLDLMMHGVQQNEALLAGYRERGVAVHFVVYDLLPVLQPDAFPFDAEPHFAAWLRTIGAVSDGIVCISRAVADELAGWYADHPPARLAPLQLGYFHLGADIDASTPSTGMPDDAPAMLAQLALRPTLLMVGTVEPRKGHAQALDAFERLWADGAEVNLVIIGKHGWMVDALAKRLRGHAELGRRLFWLQGVSDEMVQRLYRDADGLLIASYGEGFGLPLIEAAQHQLPIVARDLPVFREVSGEHAFYFDGRSGDQLAAALGDWLALLAAGAAPSSVAMPWLTWRESTRQLLACLVGQQWHRAVAPDRAASAAPTAPRV
jgi:glycosyltransferase involved in cell wall biosynthesis